MLDRYNFAAQMEKPQGGKMDVSGFLTPGEVYYHKHPRHAAVDTGVFDLCLGDTRIRKAVFRIRNL